MAKHTREQIIALNEEYLQALTTAVLPIFERKPDVVGDHDEVIISMKYEDFEHLCFIAEPILPGGRKNYKAYSIWKK